MNKETAESIALNLIQTAQKDINGGTPENAIWKLIEAAGVLAEVTVSSSLRTPRGYRLKLKDVPPVIITPEYCNKCGNMKKVFEIKTGAIVGNNIEEVYGCEVCD